MLTQSTRHQPTAPTLWAGTGHPPTMTVGRTSPIGGGPGLLAMPFDALRLQYASVVRSGLAQRSLLASGKLERALDALEKLMLGPLARQR